MTTVIIQVLCVLVNLLPCYIWSSIHHARPSIILWYRYLFFVFRTKLHLILCIQVHAHTNTPRIVVYYLQMPVILLRLLLFIDTLINTQKQTKKRSGKLDERDEKTRKKRMSGREFFSSSSGTNNAVYAGKY